jgi:hypothetical protein
MMFAAVIEVCVGMHITYRLGCCDLTTMMAQGNVVMAIRMLFP